MLLSIDQVMHIAELARLDLREDEITLYREQLSAVLQYAARLQELDTHAISPAATVLPVHNVLRSDEPGPSMAREEILANAPDAEQGCFRVPAVLE